MSYSSQVQQSQTYENQVQPVYTHTVLRRGLNNENNWTLCGCPKDKIKIALSSKGAQGPVSTRWSNSSNEHWLCSCWTGYWPWQWLWILNSLCPPDLAPTDLASFQLCRVFFGQPRKGHRWIWELKTTFSIIGRIISTRKGIVLKNK